MRIGGLLFSERDLLFKRRRRRRRRRPRRTTKLLFLTTISINLIYCRRVLLLPFSFIFFSFVHSLFKSLSLLSHFHVFLHTYEDVTSTRVSLCSRSPTAATQPSTLRSRIIKLFYRALASCVCARWITHRWRLREKKPTSILLDGFPKPVELLLLYVVVFFLLVVVHRFCENPRLPIWIYGG